MNPFNSHLEDEEQLDLIQVSKIPQKINNGSSHRSVMHIDKVDGTMTLAFDRTELTVDSISAGGRLLVYGCGARVVVHWLAGVLEVRGDDCDVCAKCVDGGRVIMNSGDHSEEFNRLGEWIRRENRESKERSKSTRLNSSHPSISRMPSSA